MPHINRSRNAYIGTLPACVNTTAWKAFSGVCKPSVRSASTKYHDKEHRKSLKSSQALSCHSMMRAMGQQSALERAAGLLPGGDCMAAPHYLMLTNGNADDYCLQDSVITTVQWGPQQEDIYSSTLRVGTSYRN